MEEAAQILDVETVIPMLLQRNNKLNNNTGNNRLKRIVLIGDHYQLPPIVQNQSLQQYSRLDQSLFSRLVRLGCPTVILDKQGRARPEIADLYSWRYSQLISQANATSDVSSRTASNGSNANESVVLLGNLSNVLYDEIYQLSNPGFLHTFQLINVPEFNNQGETQPTPFFYQNLGEAEYVVATYQYMRLLGYPANKISILTTYNGQKQLIEDIVKKRCKFHRQFGLPGQISTVDKYQGQQNDYILLSLVRTYSVGHLRDVRRLVVALSRGKLGLYVFCKQSLFENCFELNVAFSKLLTRPTSLQLVMNESYGNVSLAANFIDTKDDETMTGKVDEECKIDDKKARKVGDQVPLDTVFTVPDVTAMGVLVYQLVQHANAKVSASQSVPASVIESQLPESIENDETNSIVKDGPDSLSVESVVQENVITDNADVDVNTSSVAVVETFETS